LRELLNYLVRIKNYLKINPKILILFPSDSIEVSKV
jgi:hypothetical protein